MNWHETILHIRNSQEYRDLVDQAYFEEDLSLNVERFRSRPEFRETLKLLKSVGVVGGKLLDVGSGNGISSISFALNGFDVTVVEPDPSDTIGANAIRKLAKIYNIFSLPVYECYAEEMPFENETFDVVYVRQAMHHAADLNNFVKECSRVLKKDGILITVRDHVVFDEADKQWFLDSHPLHRFYGGENAFSPDEYRNAMRKSGLEIVQELHHFDSVINYFPMTEEEFIGRPLQREEELLNKLRSKIGIFAGIGILKNWYFKRNGYLKNRFWDERKVSGRMYTYISRKK